jgi:hypothetical protein
MPTSTRAVAALPAGVAALLAAFFAWVLRRKVLSRPPSMPPPDEDLEYHL